MQQNKFTVKICSNEQDFLNLHDHWNALVKQSGADIFQTHEWQYAWWKIFGGDNQLFIITLWHDDLLISILPFFIDQKSFLGVISSKCLKLIGSHISNPRNGVLPVEMAFGGYLDIIVHPHYYDKVDAEIADILTNFKTDFDEFHFDELPENSYLAYVISLLPESAEWNIKTNEASKCYQVLLMNKWEDYLASLSKTTRKKVRQGLRDLNDRKEFDLIEAKDIHQFDIGFDRLVELHQTRWNNLGQPGIFADRRVLEFYKTLCQQLFKKNQAHISWAEAEGEIFAVELEYSFNSIIYSVQGGIDVDSYYSKFSPSNVIFYHSIQEGFQDGYTSYDWLRGVSNYKSSYSNHTLHNKKIHIYSTHLSDKISYYLCDRSESLRIKLKNERLILGVYLSRNKGVKGFINYAVNFVQKFQKNFRIE